MRLSSETAIVIAALGFAALMATQERRSQWKLSYSSTPDMVNFGIEQSKPGSRWSSSHDVPLSAFRGLNPSQGGPVRFEYVADAGTFICSGRFSFGVGSGSFLFQPNPRFSADLQQLGYDPPRGDQYLTMALLPLTLDFARGIRDAGLEATTDQLLELRTHGIALPYIRETQNAGYRRFTARDYIDMKIHGVSTDFLRALKRAGYDLDSRQVVDLKIHGIGTDYIRDLDLDALRPAPTDLVQFKIHGIGPDFLREARDLGFRFTAQDLVDLKMHGVSPDYLRKLKSTGIRDLSARQITQLKMHGVE